MKTGHWHHNYRLEPDTSFGFVYLIKNLISNKSYIGKKQYYSYKKKKKFKPSKWESYTSSSKALNLDIEKYGKENFHFEILFETVTRAWLTYMEVKLQYQYDVLTARDENGERLWYNGMIGAIKFIPGHEWTDDSRKKLGESLKKMWANGIFEDRDTDGPKNGMWGKKHTEETRALMSLVQTGKTQSPEQIAKRVAKNTGKTRTEQTKQKMSEWQKGLKKATHTCVKCGKTMSIQNAKRYGHYDGNC